ncbi:MAG: T9SS type A sorting domain-containing protein [Flavobacteriales bacterium]
MKQLLLFAFLVLLGTQSFAKPESSTNPFTSFKKELPSWEAQIYPNPNNGEFSISVKGSEADLNVAVFNVIGEKIHEVKISGKDGAQLDLKGTKKGLYVVQVIDETRGEVVTRRMQIR